MGGRKDMLPGRRLAASDLGRVLVLGRGVTGNAVIDYLEPLLGTRVRELAVWEGEPGTGSFDLCIASPGISERSELYRAAKASASELISEVEFAWREASRTSRWIAVTGTNGKTTTASLIAHALEACGMDVRLVGNIGQTCISAVAEDIRALSDGASANDAGSAFVVYVAEMSSYQLASSACFVPDIAVVLNIKPDHLSWHGSHGAYAEAKWRILGGEAGAPACAVLNATDDEVRERIRALRTAGLGHACIPLGTAAGIESDMRVRCGAPHAAFVDEEGRLRIAYQGREHALVRTSELRILGRHNIENALAAASACIAFSALPHPLGEASGSIALDDERIAEGLRSFEPISHRIETVGQRSGVTFVNDSKATNVDATLAALTAFPAGNAIVLLGGRDKGTDLAELVRAVGGAAKGCVLFGESLERFRAAFDAQGVPYECAPHMAEAVRAAFALAAPGDVVLLSPACASFDEFSCFEERGMRFAEMVEALPDTRG